MLVKLKSIQVGKCKDFKILTVGKVPISAWDPLHLGNLKPMTRANSVIGWGGGVATLCKMLLNKCGASCHGWL